MELTASTSVFLCAGVPFDNTYEHVRLFERGTERLAFFNSYAVKRVTGCTYQRQNKYISVPFLYDEIANCDYLFFQNETDGKYYFAFITGIEYQNPSLSRVYFEIDVFQTWFTDDSLRESFVEREHVNDDSFGANLVQESLETGDYIYHIDNEVTANLSDFMYVMGVTEIVNAAGIPNAPEQGGGEFLGLYSALNYIAFAPEESETLRTYIETYSIEGKADAIATIFVCPKNLLPLPITDTVQWLKQDTLLTGDFCKISRPHNIDGYFPKNNKTLQSPYIQLLATDYSGNAKEFSFEYFSRNDNEAAFEIRKDLSPSSQAIVIPINYRVPQNTLSGISGQDCFKMGGWPQIAWLSDNYKNWLAQNIANLGVNAITGSISSGFSIYSAVANVAGKQASAIATGINVFGNIANTLATLYQKSIIPDSLRGTQGGGNAWIASKQYNLHLIPVTIRANFAKRIDDYFTHYGYKVLEFKKPNIYGRKYWNFVKLTDCNINLNAPIEATEKIKQMFLNGVTIWHTNDIKNYSLDNVIVGG